VSGSGEVKDDEDEEAEDEVAIMKLIVAYLSIIRSLASI